MIVKRRIGTWQYLICPPESGDCALVNLSGGKIRFVPANSSMLGPMVDVPEDDPALASVMEAFEPPDSSKTAAFNPNQPRCPKGTGETAGEFSNSLLGNCNPQTEQLSDLGLDQREESLRELLADEGTTARRRRRLQEELNLVANERQRRYSQAASPLSPLSKKPETGPGYAKFFFSDEASRDHFVADALRRGEPHTVDGLTVTIHTDQPNTRDPNAPIVRADGKLVERGFDVDGTTTERLKSDATTARALRPKDITDKQFRAWVHAKFGAMLGEDEDYLDQVTDTALTMRPLIGRDGTSLNSHDRPLATTFRSELSRVQSDFMDQVNLPFTVLGAEVSTFKAAVEAVADVPEFQALAEEYGWPEYRPVSPVPPLETSGASVFADSARLADFKPFIAIDAGLIKELHEGDPAAYGVSDPEVMKGPFATRSQPGAGLRNQDGRFIADRSLQGLLIHEATHWFETQQAKVKGVPGVSERLEPLVAYQVVDEISKYASVSKAELLAESVAIIASPDYDIDTFSPEVQRYFRDVESWLKS